jgi:hypothetical protein
MVFAVQCPNPKCKKFMLVEDHQQGKVVQCLICRTGVKIGVLSQEKPAAPQERGLGSHGK